ncbi:hypothetical protein J3458_015178 [Metarhizium acridum]|uniref:uncharacterized protein n=1 Tax=Metarhizium acridum TaxID=92637 RepID=UPI001C6AAFD7|nr:hypothetical protein J3458_015178 [Metarhizium acridum]
MFIKADCPYSSLQDCPSSPDCQPDDEGVKRQIQTLSRGLVEVTAGQIAQFIHQTVKDFFVEKGLMMATELHRVPLGTSKSDFVVGTADDQLSRSCVRYLAMKDITQIIVRDAVMGFDVPLVKYAATNWVGHGKESEKRGFSQEALLDCFACPPETILRHLAKVSQEVAAWLVDFRIEGASALHIISGRCFLGLLRVIVQGASQTGTEIDMQDADGRTPLMWAARYGQEAMARLLLEKGAHIDARCRTYGETSLIWAARKGHGAVVELLLEEGADINARCSRYGQTALIWASGNGHEAVVRLLLDKGATDTYDQTALICAANAGHEDVVWLLLARWPVIDARTEIGQTLLRIAVRHWFKPIVLLLPNNGADVNAKDELGRTMLFWAAETGHRGVLEVL